MTPLANRLGVVRVIAAGVFVCAAAFGLAAVIGALGGFDSFPRWGLGPVVMVATFALLALALWLFNPRGSDPFGRLTPGEHLRALEQQGLLDSTEFRAVRAFGVEEFDDEGLHYFLELIDGRVLVLSGQYLYDDEPISDDPEMNRPRSFPCTEFTLRRHQREGYVADIRCRGSVLEPEVMAPAFKMKNDWREVGIPEDGDVIVDATYEDPKRQWTRLPPAR